MIPKWFTPLILTLLLITYSTGSRSSQELSWQDIPVMLQAHGSNDCDGNPSDLTPNDNNTIFVHPGLLLFGIDWGGHRAVDTGLLLVGKGYGSGILEIRSRRGRPVYQRMLEDNGTRFLGIHYSMGGEPQVLANALQATDQASRERGQTLRYYPLMVEPFGFDMLDETVDLDSPHLGQVVVLVSSGHSLFRPNIEAAPSRVLNHHKLHILYPEDYGLQWDHFSVLTDLRESDGSKEPKHRRALELFQTVAESLLAGLDSRQLNSRLARLKLRYALEDKRSAQQQWLNQLVADDCAPGAERIPSPHQNVETR